MQPLQSLRSLRLVLAAVLLICGLSPVSGSASDKPGNSSARAGDAASVPLSVEAEALYEKGKQALSSSRYIESTRYLNRAIVAGRQDVELLYWLGMAYWNRKMADSASRAYRQAIALDPDGDSEWSLYALENLAMVYGRNDRLPESEAAYRSSLAREVRPEWILKIRNQQAELALAMGTFTPDESTVYNDNGEVTGGVGPGDMHTNRNFEIARHTSDPVKEERYYRLAITTDPTMYQSYFNLGLALVHQGRPATALEWLARSDSVWKADSDYNPMGIDKSDAHAFMAKCYLELGDLQAAANHADKAVATGDGDFWARLYSMHVRVARGKAAEALPILEGMLIDNPEHAELLDILSEAYDSLGKK